MFPRKEKRKKKSNDYWKDSILIRPFQDKKKINKFVPSRLDHILETGQNMFHEKMCCTKFNSIYVPFFSP